MWLMKTLVLGCGNIGSVAAEDLAQHMSSTEVVVADKDTQRAKSVAEKINKPNASWTQIDVANHYKLVNSVKDFDLVMGFLPGNLGYRLTEACIEAEKNLVDVSFMAENPLELNERAAKVDVTIVPDCGLAPGISNVLVGHAVSQLEKVRKVHIMVGGLPEKPVPPLGYTVTWSPESLIDEYTRTARVVEKGKITEAEVLSGIEKVDFPNFGTLESFYTDGLRTLLFTIRNAEEMWEKTLRYPRHAEKIKLLKDLGFFEEEKVKIGETLIAPRKLTVKLLERKLFQPEIGDIVALKVEVFGIAHGAQKSYVYHLLDRCDQKRKITAMARTTAFPASIVAQLILKKVAKEKGVVPPEKLGMNSEVFRQFWEELKARGIEILVG
jgi:saccharopine dehydrogenase-like NADP-dependent oxidoreductase